MSEIRRRKGPWAIGHIAASVTRSVFERHGLGRGEIAHAWPHLVGNGLARHCRPERIVPPRKGQSRGGSYAGGTLYIIASESYAVDVHYAAGGIIEGVNALYGEQVVSRIKVKTSADRESLAKASDRPVAARPQNPDKFDEIRQGDLRHALARLEAGILAEEPDRTSPLNASGWLNPGAPGKTGSKTPRP